MKEFLVIDDKTGEPLEILAFSEDEPAGLNPYYVLGYIRYNQERVAQEYGVRTATIDEYGEAVSKASEFKGPIVHTINRWNCDDGYYPDYLN